MPPCMKSPVCNQEDRCSQFHVSSLWKALACVHEKAKSRMGLKMGNGITLSSFERWSKLAVTKEVINNQPYPQPRPNPSPKIISSLHAESGYQTNSHFVQRLYRSGTTASFCRKLDVKTSPSRAMKRNCANVTMFPAPGSSLHGSRITSEAPGNLFTDISQLLT